MKQAPKKKPQDLVAQLAELGYDVRVGLRDDTPPSGLDRADLRKAIQRQTRTRTLQPRSESTSPPPHRTSPSKPVKAVAYRRGVPRRAPPHKKSPPPSAAVPLESGVPGAVATAPNGGSAYLVTAPTANMEQGTCLNDAFVARLGEAASGLNSRIAGVCNGARMAVEDMVFMDIETTGLSSSPVFLIGVMIWDGGGFRVKQFLARDYSEEAAILSFYANECAERRLLVTFNGKTFDVPYLRTRAVSNGIPLRQDLAHLDLLHASRRAWRRHLPNCKLQTLERHVCGRRRRGDIPGSEIPDAYHEFVRTGNAWQIVDILKHNALDLVTLADILTRFPDDGLA